MIQDNLLMLLLVFFATGMVQFFLIRKQIASVADPLFIFVVTSSFSLALGYFVVDSPWLLARIFLYFACFYVGFKFAVGRYRPKPIILQINRVTRQFRAIVIVCCLVYLGLNMFMWAKSGVILLSDNPSLLKTDAYSGGYGFIRRFNWSVGVFTLIASLYWWLLERTFRSVFFVVVTALIAIAGGGKSALLPAILAIGLFIAKPYSSYRLSIDVERLRRRIPIFLGFALIPVMIVLLTENEAAGDAFFAFVTRLFYFGDVLLYWGQEAVRSQFAVLDPIDYLLDTFGSVLGALRLIDYSIPIGNQFVRSTLPIGTEFSESLGPNLPFYVRGELYLGVFFAPLHALIIGYIFGRLRKLFFNYGGRSLLVYSLLSFAVISSLTLMTEEGLAVGKAFDFIIFFLPIYVMTLYFRFPVSHTKLSSSIAKAP